MMTAQTLSQAARSFRMRCARRLPSCVGSALRARHRKSDQAHAAMPIPACTLRHWIIEQEPAAGQTSSKALACNAQRTTSAPQSLCGMPLGCCEQHRVRLADYPHLVRERISVAGRQRSVTSSVMPCVQARHFSSGCNTAGRYLLG